MDAGLWGDEDEEEIKSPVEDIIGSYVSYSGEAITNLFSPFTILFVMWTEPVMKLGEKYSILTTDFQYFYMFAFVMIWGEALIPKVAYRPWNRFKLLETK